MTERSSMSDGSQGGRPRSRGERIRLALERFEELVGLPLPERSAHLDALRAEDSELARELDAMLAADERSSTAMTVGGGLEALARISASGLREEDARSFEAPLPLLAGQYRILRRIGEGGMGVVYEAEQALPRRKVALKAIRGGLASRQILRRFEQEAHILGRLHHPGIAQVYEAGANDPVSGDQAFIAMELVEGEPLDVWGRERSSREKVELLARACDAVQHAHQRRVVHRDLKPANLLVDQSGQPKILDFGVARLADDAREEALRTRAGQLVGTLAYMSPEQAAGDPDEVDARTDVYALGVMLYELLAGRLPHPPEGKTLPELALAIQGEEPPRLTRLVPSIPRDLDFIAGKALAKERERRYQSAHELAEDLRRWLAGAPVRARGDSALYVLRRQVRRHRWIAGSAFLALLSLLAFALTATAGKRRADRDAARLAESLRSSNIELGRALARTDNLTAAEQLAWDARLQRPDEHAHWALWEIYSRFPCRRAFVGHADSVIAMKMSAGGELLATGSHDKSVRVWDWVSGECLSTRSFDSMITGLCFTPEGSTVCGAGWNGALAAWDARSGSERWSASEPPIAPLVQMAAASERALAACVGQTEECVLIDLGNGAIVRRLRLPEARLLGVALDREGDRLLLGEENGLLHLVDAESGAKLWTVEGHASGVVSTCFLPGGERVASGDHDGLVLLRSAADGELLGRLDSGIGSVRSISFSRAHDRVLLSCAGGVALFAPGDVSQEPRFHQAGYAGILTDDQSELVTGSVGGGIRVWDLDPASPVRSLPVRIARRVGMAIGPRGELLARDAGEGLLEVVDLEGEVRASIPSALPSIDYSTFSADASRIALHSKPVRVAVWSLPSAEPLFALDLPASPKILRFAPEGNLLAAAGEDGRTLLLDGGSGREQGALQHAAGAAERFAFSFDGRRLVSSHRGRRIEVWELESRTLERSIETPRAVLAVCLDATGEHVYAGTWEGRVLVYERATGRLLRNFEGHAQIVPMLTPSRSGRFVVSAGSDGLLRLWTHEAGVCLLALDARAGGLVGLALDDDLDLLRAVYWDGGVREWDLAAFEPHIAGNEPYQRALRAAAR